MWKKIPQSLTCRILKTCIQKSFCGNWSLALANLTSPTTIMKKSNVSSSSKSAVHVGSEVYLEPLEIEPGFIRKTPDNRGKKYFKYCWKNALTRRFGQSHLEKQSRYGWMFVAYCELIQTTRSVLKL